MTISFSNALDNPTEYSWSPILRVWIKRRLVSGAYETNWQRVDTLDGIGQIINYSGTEEAIDADSGIDGNFEVQTCRLEVNNPRGYWNGENTAGSFWFPATTYLNRKGSQIKIDQGYYDFDDDEEFGVDTVFQGFIDSIVIGVNSKAVINCVSYADVFNRYKISDLGWVSTLLNDSCTYDFTSANEGDAGNIYDGDPGTKIESSGSNDTTDEVLTITFDEARDFEEIEILGSNIRSGNIKYWNGSSYVDFSPAISISSNDLEDLKFEFTKVTNVASVKITLSTTIVANKEKQVSQINIPSPSMTISEIITAITNQSKITDFIPYVAPSGVPSLTVEYPHQLNGTYWDVIKELAYHATCVPLLSGTTWSFKQRTAITGSSQFEFRGGGTYIPNIIQIEDYDDEGAKNVCVSWRSKNKAGSRYITSTTSNTTLALKYNEFSEIRDVDLPYYSDADRKTILDNLLSVYGTPRPNITFKMLCTINEISILDRVTLRSYGTPLPLVNYPRIGVSFIIGTSEIPEIYSSLLIQGGSTWYVTGIEKSYTPCYSRIRLERREV